MQAPPDKQLETLDSPPILNPSCSCNKRVNSQLMLLRPTDRDSDLIVPFQIATTANADTDVEIPFQTEFPYVIIPPQDVPTIWYDTRYPTVPILELAPRSGKNLMIPRLSGIRCIAKSWPIASNVNFQVSTRPADTPQENVKHSKPVDAIPVSARLALASVTVGPYKNYEHRDINLYINVTIADATTTLTISILAYDEAGNIINTTTVATLAAAIAAGTSQLVKVTALPRNFGIRMVATGATSTATAGVQFELRA